MVSRDRGQLLLVAGIMIGLVVVSTAVLLNVVVVPGDATAEGVSADAGAAHANFEPMQSDLARLFEYTTTTTGTYGAPLPFAERDDLAQETVAFSSVTSNLSATSTGALLNVSFVPSESVEGRAAVVWRNPRQFSWLNANPELIRNAGSVTAVWLNVSRDSGSGPLRVTVENSTGGEWELVVRQDSIESIRPDGTTTTCQRTPGWPTRANLTAGNADTHVSGDGCSHIQVAAGLSDPPYTVEFTDGHQFTGQYVVTAGGNPNIVGPQAPGRVYVNPAFRVTYLSSDISYESTFAVYNETGR